MLIAVAVLSGCAKTGSVIESGCVIFEPIYISRADVLTEGTAVQIEAHNLTGRAVCGW